MAQSVTETLGGGNSTAGTSVSVTMPSTKSGRLVVIVATNGPPSSVSWPAGWDVLIDDTDGDGSTSGLYAAERELDNTEGSSITVTLGSSQTYTWNWQRIIGHGPATAAIQSSVASGTSATPDPPNSNPGTSKERLWIAVYGCDNGSTEHSSYPSSYTLGQTQEDFSDHGFSNVPASGMSARLLTASSENPGTYGINISDQWLASTFAIDPLIPGLPSFRAANRGILRGVSRGVY